VGSIAIAAIGVFGALIGSFLNVVVWRVPRKESLNHPASHCPNCDHPIRPYDNIPVISWLVLRGRCRDCRAPISVRYPLVELATALTFALVTWWAISSAWFSVATGASAAASIIALVAYLYLAAVSIALLLIDLDTFTLPNRIVLPSLVVIVVLLSASSILVSNYAALVTAVIGGAALFVAYLLMAVLYRGGMGFGDVKLAPTLGFALGWLSWGVLAVGAFAPFVLGGVFSIALIVLKRAGRKSRIPFGPWMLVGAWVGISLGNAVSAWYLSLFGLG
jgi:leader peptidase (prepilin peptidase)/N-methyltransferase